MEGVSFNTIAEIYTVQFELQYIVMYNHALSEYSAKLLLNMTR